MEGSLLNYLDAGHDFRGYRYKTALTCYAIGLQYIMIEQKKCKHCKKKFYGTKRARFCSTKCRVASWRKGK